MLPEIKIVFNNENYVGNTTAIKDVHKNFKNLQMNVINNTLQINANKTENISIEIFGLNGFCVAKLYNGILKAGSTSFDLSSLAKGSYIVRVRANKILATHPIMLK